MHVNRILRDERGFTMPELLVVMVTLGIVVACALALMEVVMRQSNGVVARTDAMQRGRLVLDDITRQIRSQVCLNEGTGSLVAGTANSLTFYADLSDGTAVPSRHTLTYDPAAHRIREDVYRGTRATAWGTVTFPAQPSQQRILLSDVVPDTLADGKAAPFFAYYRFNTDNPPRPELALAPPLNAASLGVAARIQIRFSIQPHGGSRDERLATSLQDAVFLRTSNPNATSPDPTCR